MIDQVYASFMIRIWLNPRKEIVQSGKLNWSGEIESVQTGQTRQFEGVEGLARLLAEQLADFSLPSGQHQPTIHPHSRTDEVDES